MSLATFLLSSCSATPHRDALSHTYLFSADLQVQDAARRMRDRKGSAEEWRDEYQSACHRYLEGYRKSYRGFNLKKIDRAIHSCEMGQDFATAELFLDFRNRYLETHPYELNSKKGVWSNLGQEHPRQYLMKGNPSSAKPPVATPVSPTINWTWGRGEKGKSV